MQVQSSPVNDRAQGRTSINKKAIKRKLEEQRRGMVFISQHHWLPVLVAVVRLVVSLSTLLLGFLYHTGK